MLPDDRLRELLHDADERTSADPRALASIYSKVDAERRRRSRRPRWVVSLLRAAPALAGVAATLIVLLGIVQLLPDTEPAATPGTSPTGFLGTPTAPSPSATNQPVSDEVLVENLTPHVAEGPCLPWDIGPGGDDVLSPSGYATSRVRASCPGPDPDGPRVRSALYATREAAAAEYDAIVNDQGLAAGGECAKAVPANAPWGFPGYLPSGSLACFARNGGVQYVWTENQPRMLGQFLAPNAEQGRAFWQLWFATHIGVDEPASTPTFGEGSCVRAADRDFSDAFDVFTCARVGGENPVTYVQYYADWIFGPFGTSDFINPHGDPFPDDPMSKRFHSIMAEGGLEVNTAEGCYETKPGMYMWGALRPGFSRETGRVSDPAAAYGFAGCFSHTVGDRTTTQLVVTNNAIGIMVLWDAADIEHARAFLESWAGEEHLL